MAMVHTTRADQAASLRAPGVRKDLKVMDEPSTLLTTTPD